MTVTRRYVRGDRTGVVDVLTRLSREFRFRYWGRLYEAGLRSRSTRRGCPRPPFLGCVSWWEGGRWQVSLTRAHDSARWRFESLAGPDHGLSGAP